MTMKTLKELLELAGSMCPPGLVGDSRGAFVLGFLINTTFEDSEQRREVFELCFGHSFESGVRDVLEAIVRQRAVGDKL